MNASRLLASSLSGLLLLTGLSSGALANDPPAAKTDHGASKSDHAAAKADHAAAPAVSADAALARLTAGNKRFVAGALTHPAQSTSRRTETAAGQHPFAIVLTCADSRLSPEIIFDQGIGDLFVVRNAGNLLSDHVIGSIEYAVEHLHASLVVVLGHSKCGAVSAAVGGGEVPGHIKSIVATLAPAAAAGKKKPGDPVENTVRIGAKLSAAALAQAEPILTEFVKAGKVKVVAARYDLSSGEVEVFP